jgi:hypothetical protein
MVHSAGISVDGSAAVALANDLVARSPDVADRRAQHVDEPGEREEHEDRQPEEDVQLEHQRGVGDVGSPHPD